MYLFRQMRAETVLKHSDAESGTEFATVVDGYVYVFTSKIGIGQDPAGTHTHKEWQRLHGRA
jgi:hypothetical protein